MQKFTDTLRQVYLHLIRQIKMERDWSILLPEVLALVFKRLSIKDGIRCRAVCMSWLLVRREYTTPLLKFPWLVLGHDESKPKSREIFSIVEQRSDDIYVPKELLRGRSCCGSSKGWLITVDEKYDAHLLHPLTGKELKLPPLPHYWYNNPEKPIIEGEFAYKIQDYYIVKFAMSCDPNINIEDCIVMIMYGNQEQLAFCRIHREVTWTFMPSVYSTPHGAPYGIYYDLIFYKDHFYIMTCAGYVLVCNIDQDRKVEMLIKDGCYWRGEHHYLVEFMGDLLHVVRGISNYKSIWYDDLYNNNNDEDTFPPNDNMYERCRLHGRKVPIDYDSEDDHDNKEYRYFTFGFRVCKLDLTSKKSIRVESLGDHALFLGRNESISASATQFPGCKPNSIYFTHDRSLLFCGAEGYDDLGVYNLEDKKIKLVCPVDAFDPKLTPPIWYLLS